MVVVVVVVVVVGGGAVVVGVVVPENTDLSLQIVDAKLKDLLLLIHQN